MEGGEALVSTLTYVGQRFELWQLTITMFAKWYQLNHSSVPTHSSLIGKQDTRNFYIILFYKTINPNGLPLAEWAYQCDGLLVQVCFGADMVFPLDAKLLTLGTINLRKGCAKFKSDPTEKHSNDVV